MKKKNICLVVLFTILLTGCPDNSKRHEYWENTRVVIGPVALKNHLAYIDSARDRVVVVKTTNSAPEIYDFKIGRNSIFTTPAPDRKHLVVLTRGEEAISKGQVDEAPKLWSINVTEKSSTQASYDIGSPFDRVAISEHGGIALAYFSSGGFDAASGVFRNPNEFAVVNLLEPASDSNPVLRTLRSFGSAPDGVILSPPMALVDAPDDSKRVFAFVLSKESISILDITHPERREVTIKLGDEIRPREIVFAPKTGTAYVRSDNAKDVLAIVLQWEEADNAMDNDYQPLLSELGAGSGPSDIAVYDDAVGRRLVLAAMPNRKEIAIINGDTGEFITVQTPDSIDRITLFPEDIDTGPRIALLASLSKKIPRVHLLPLKGVMNKLIPIDLKTVKLAEKVLAVLAIPNSEKAMIVHDADRTVLSLLDLNNRSVSPLEGVGRLDTFTFSKNGEFLVGANKMEEQVGFLSLASLHPSNMRLDDIPDKVFSMANGSILIDHNDPFGRLTYLPNSSASREESIVLNGFLLFQFLNEDY